MAISANAQWRTNFYKADELKGEEAYWSNLYIAPSGRAFCCWSNDDQIKIITEKGIFDYSDNYVKVLIGFYEGETLVEKVTSFFFVPDGDSDTAYTSAYRDSGLGVKIKEWIKNTGSVRFIASKYSGPEFDLTVPKNAGLK